MRRRRALHASEKQQTDALVTRIFDYGESSAVVHLLTTDRGAVRAVAKGAQRLRNSFRGPLDKGVLYRVRLGRRGGDGLFHLGSAAALEPFPRLRSDPARFAAASVVFEVSGDLMREDEPHPELFRLAVFTLKVIDRAPATRIPLATAFFLARAVALSGHPPEIARCVECGRALTERDRPLLGPARGGVLHPRCAQGEPGARSVSRASLELLDSFWRRPASELLAADLPAPALRALRRLLVEWLEYTLERGFRAAAALEREFAASDRTRG